MNIIVSGAMGRLEMVMRSLLASRTHDTARGDLRPRRFSHRLRRRARTTMSGVASGGQELDTIMIPLMMHSERFPARQRLNFRQIHRLTYPSLPFSPCGDGVAVVAPSPFLCPTGGTRRGMMAGGTVRALRRNMNLFLSMMHHRCCLMGAHAVATQRVASIRGPRR